LRERGARGPVKSTKRYAFEDQRRRLRADYREVEKILADVDTYEWPDESSGQRPDE